MKTKTAPGIFIFLFLCLWPAQAARAGQIVGGDTVYAVQKGDTVNLIASRFGVRSETIIKENGLTDKATIKAGQKLRINTRKIVPKHLENGIVINIADRTLYYFKDGRLDVSFPVGLGIPQWRGLREWRTPEGKFVITGKEKNPTWYVPASMQRKMEQEDRDYIPIVIPPGPDNPLGRYALKTSIPGILIHETLWPTSISRFRSHGCIRVAPENMEVLFGKAEKHMEGEILYMPVKAAVTEDGRVFLEVHSDVYGKAGNLRAIAEERIEQLKATKKVDWEKVDVVLKEKPGVAVDITF